MPIRVGSPTVRTVNYTWSDQEQRGSGHEEGSHNEAEEEVQVVRVSQRYIEEYRPIYCREAKDVSCSSLPQLNNESDDADYEEDSWEPPMESPVDSVYRLEIKEFEDDPYYRSVNEGKGNSNLNNPLRRRNHEESTCLQKGFKHSRIDSSRGTCVL